MSIQSDVEMLSVSAMENYAKEHNLTGKEVADLFHKYQVYEKIILQYEYLHQLDIGDTIKYVEEIVAEQGVDMIVYHGTNVSFEEVKLEKSNNRRDFGKGFYCTILKEQASSWAKRLNMRVKPNGENAHNYVYSYVFHQADTLKIKRFATLNEEWLEFVKENRSKGGIQHSYDVVIGPVADDNTMETVQLYIANILSAKEAMERLQYSKVNNQISFHTERALQYLTFVNCEEV